MAMKSEQEVSVWLVCLVGGIHVNAVCYVDWANMFRKW